MSTTAASTKPALNELLKTDNWQCTGCYAPNKKEALKCACCAAPKPGSTAATTASPQIQPNKPAFSFGMTNQASSAAPINKTFTFGNLNKPPEGHQATASPSVKFDFGSRENPIQPPSTNLQPFAAKNQTSPAKTNLDVSPSKGVANLFGAPSAGLFGAKAVSTENALPSFTSLASNSSALNEKCFGNLKDFEF